MRLYIITVLMGLAAMTQAQFQFFEHMFQGQGQQQQQQPQNVASDSAWYQQTYESGMNLIASSDARVCNPLLTVSRSALYRLPLPWNPGMRVRPTPLPMRVSRCGR